MKGLFRNTIANPFNPIVCGLALVLTILTAIIAAQFKEPPLDFYNHLVNNAGPAGYLMIVTIFMNLIAHASVWRSKARPATAYLGALAIAAALPMALGLLSSANNVARSILTIADVIEAGLQSDPSPAALLRAIPASIDTATLGLAVSAPLLCLTGIYMAATNKKVQPAGRAYVSPAAGDPSAHP